MVDTIQTYVINDGFSTFSDLSDYCGCLYYLMGAGGVSGTSTFPNNVSFGGSSGYVMSGYLDFKHPYPCTEVVLFAGTGIPNATLNALFTNDPTNGTHPISIKADQGQVWNYGDYTSSSTTYITGFFQPGISSLQFQNQRGQLGPTGPIKAAGFITSNYGSGFTGGGGFYGSNLTDVNAYGYGSGAENNPSNSYGIISLIPKNMIYNGNTGSTGTYFFDSPGSTGISGSSNLLLYSLLAGGGGGGSGGGNNAGSIAGGGGGGSGDICSGFFNSKADLTVNIGSGGVGAPNSGSNTSGNNGGNSSLNSIVVVGGDGGGGDSNGGRGFYGGGAPSFNDTTQSGFTGLSLSNILSYNGANNNSANSGGGGIYPFGYGTSGSNNGGGGGGYYAGGGSLSGELPIATLYAQGYGCGGGGGSYVDSSQQLGGGGGSPGYAILRYLDSPNIKLVTITPSSKINYFSLQKDFSACRGFWFFLHGDTNGGTCKSYHNTGHFLIENDGVKSIACTFPRISNLTYSQIQVQFNILNGLPQIFTLQSSTGWSNPTGAYINIFFYN